MSFSLPFFIARRYFRAKKSPLVTLIGRVAVLSIGVSAAAMILVLSVMNGMNRFVAERFWQVDADLRVEAVYAKFFEEDGRLSEIRAVPGVAEASAILKDQAILTYGQQNCMVYLEGVDENFTRVSAVAQHIYSGEYLLQSRPALIADNEVLDGGVASVLMGGGVYEQMQISPSSPQGCQLYTIDAKLLNSPLGLQGAVSSCAVFASGLFSCIPEYDNQYVFADIEFARRVLKAEGRVSSIDIKVAPGENVKKVKKALQMRLGSDFSVKDRIEQQASMFKSMRAEKLIIIAVFAFIMLIATFTMVANQMLLMYEKRLDCAVLSGMGMRPRNIKRVFFLNGLLVNVCGTIGGLALGSLLAFGQQRFGWIKLGNSGNYITDAYPVFWQYGDVLAVFAIGLAIGLLASAIPLKQINGFTQRLVSE